MSQIQSIEDESESRGQGLLAVSGHRPRHSAQCLWGLGNVTALQFFKF